MPLSRGLVIFDATVAVSGGGGGTTTGSWVEVPPEMLEGALVLDATELGGTTPAYTVTVTHGWGDALATEDVDAFAATSGTSAQRQVLGQDEWAIATAADESTLRPYIRATVAVTGTNPTGRIKVVLWKRSPA